MVGWVLYFKINQLESVFELKSIKRICYKIIKICDKSFDWPNSKLKHILWLVLLVVITFNPSTFTWSFGIPLQSHTLILDSNLQVGFKMLHDGVVERRRQASAFDSHDESDGNTQLASFGIKIFSLFHYKTNRKRQAPITT